MNRYTDRNTEQCWNCKNQVGSKIFDIDARKQELPECRVSNHYMTVVQNILCEYFTEKGMGVDGE